MRRDQSVKAIALTDLATILVPVPPDGSVLRVTLGGNRTLATPTTTGLTPRHGDMFMLEVTQDGTGSRTLTLSSGYGFSADITALPTLSTVAGKMDKFLFQYDSTGATWDLISYNRGF